MISTARSSHPVQQVTGISPWLAAIYRIVRILLVHPERSEGPEIQELTLRQRAANAGSEPILAKYRTLPE